METLATFPTELVTTIFVEGARMSTHLACTLCLVARWTRALAMPYLYSTIALETRQQKTKLYETLSKGVLPVEGRGDFNPQEQIQNLWIESVSSHTVDLFKRSINLIRLAVPILSLMWIVHNSTPTVLFPPMLSKNSITCRGDLDVLILDDMIDLSGYAGSDPVARSPLFQKVKYLRLSTSLKPDQPITLEPFCKLSHFAMPCRLTDISPLTDSFKEILDKPTITAFVLMIYSDETSQEERSAILEAFEKISMDYSVLQVLESDRGRLRQDWEIEARGGESIWKKAEEYTSAIKRQG